MAPSPVPSPRRDVILLSPNAPGIFFNDPLSDRTGASCFHDRKPCQCNLSVQSYGCSLVCSSVCLYLPLRVYTLYIYFFYFSFILPVGPHANPSSAESLLRCLQFLQAWWRPNPCLSFYFVYLPVFYEDCARTQWYTVVADIPRPRTSLSGAASLLPRPWSVSRHTPSLKTETLMKKMRRMMTKQSTAVRILVPRGPRGRSLLSPKHPLL